MGRVLSNTSCGSNPDCIDSSSLAVTSFGCVCSCLSKSIFDKSHFQVPNRPVQLHHGVEVARYASRVFLESGPPCLTG